METAAAESPAAHPPRPPPPQGKELTGCKAVAAWKHLPVIICIMPVIMRIMLGTCMQLMAMYMNAIPITNTAFCRLH